MQVEVGSRHLATEVTVAPDVTGRDHLVVVVKATWNIPDEGQRPRPLSPEPIVLVDEYFGDPGESPLRYGADLARFKPRCDIIFDATAYAPGGVATRDLVAGFEVGSVLKRVRVTGPRRWTGSGNDPQGYRLGDPEPFLQVPMHFGRAFGGARWHERDGQRLCEVLDSNPVGVGFAGMETMAQLAGASAPQLMSVEHPLERPTANGLPVALSAVGRHWQPRRGFAGTYDAVWQHDVFPLLPRDFDDQFNQCAPLDQQMSYPRGGEPVRLVHLMQGRPDLRFALPKLDMQVRVLRNDFSQAAPSAHVDTLFFDVDRGRFSVVWRATLPILRRLQEIKQVAIGPIDPVWWDRQRLGGGCAGCRDDVPAQGVEEVQSE
ncbi:DUF2169 family type VI secretion system accessory protein [Roseateles sp. MS654]|uniref:DUF2169 family type VI secretion system accessory protein n=1 Tax=Roseateles sp. MS654 TaxID=3412685 RepID=UPI003C2C192C